MPNSDIQAIAAELLTAKKQGSLVQRPSANYQDFDIGDAYTVGAELTRQLREQGRTPTGRKIGFTNPTMWPRLGLDAVIWAYTYDNTVQYAPNNQITFNIKGLAAPKIEPEIVFKLRTPLALSGSSEAQDPLKILEAVEWLALGFEIVDCNYANWHFKAADMVADFGFHAALLIGEPQPLAANQLDIIAKQLQEFTLKLTKNGEAAAEGAGRNVMGSPVLSLGSVAELVGRQAASGQLAAGEVITSGTLTDAMFVAAGETWQALPTGLALPMLSVTFESR